MDKISSAHAIKYMMKSTVKLNSIATFISVKYPNAASELLQDLHCTVEQLG